MESDKTTPDNHEHNEESTALDRSDCFGPAPAGGARRRRRSWRSNITPSQSRQLETIAAEGGVIGRCSMDAEGTLKARYRHGDCALTARISRGGRRETLIDDPRVLTDASCVASLIPGIGGGV